MNFLVDAQLPQRLSRWLAGRGHDSVHTLDLPEANRTSDDKLNRLSLSESRILVTKDEDFVDSFLTRREPFKLLLVATGNISNDELLDLFDKNMAQLELSLATSSFVELSRDAIIVHA